MPAASKLGERLISPLAGSKLTQAPGITLDRFAFVNRRSRVQVSKVAPRRISDSYALVPFAGFGGVSAAVRRALSASVESDHRLETSEAAAVPTLAQ